MRREKAIRDKFAEYLFHQGTNYRAYEYLGAHITKDNKAVFRCWAPNADRVYLTGDFVSWTDECPMDKQDDGIWSVVLDEQTVKSVGDRFLYKFIIERDGVRRYKSDPYAFCSETEEKTASVLYNLDNYEWHDGEYMEKRKGLAKYLSADEMPPVPMNIYEVHLASWKKGENGENLNYREIANKLSEYVSDMGYTHIELLPVTEHPFDGSWGYQVCGYYAPTSRFGTPDDFRFFVDTMHAHGIGVILDWVPAHFPKDEHGLFEFDGGALYEYSGEDRQEHKEWGTRIFDTGRTEVQSFLISDALFWFDKYHADGLRTDAVASMLYLDYGRKPGEWNPNPDGTNINRQSVAFFKKLNGAVGGNYPDVIMTAEESTAFPEVTYKSGLGFNMKWNMGWMNDTLSYISSDPIFRGGIHNKMTFSLMYAFGENYVLPLSHDEVVHGKHSLIDKMPGDYDMKFSSQRAYLSYMFAHPGKKLTFMGCEFAQFREWDYKGELEWFMLQYPRHSEMQTFVKTLNFFYLSRPQLWERDKDFYGFNWLSADDASNNVYVFERYGNEGIPLVFAVNFSGKAIKNYRFRISNPGTYREVLNTDEIAFGGKGMLNTGALKTVKQKDKTNTLALDLPPLSAVFLEKSTREKKALRCKIIPVTAEPSKP